MRLLLDTHAFLFAIAEPDRLPKRLHTWLLDPEVERWVSVVSLWEIAVKVQIGKLNLPLDREFYDLHLRSLGANVLPVDVQHGAGDPWIGCGLPLHHRDPFDRLLIAQAVEEGLTIASRDDSFRSYAVETVW